jgi:hypothetical protein
MGKKSPAPTIFPGMIAPPTTDPIDDDDVIPNEDTRGALPDGDVSDDVGALDGEMIEAVAGSALYMLDWRGRVDTTGERTAESPLADAAIAGRVASSTTSQTDD